jgi:hypothetical protein
VVLLAWRSSTDNDGITEAGFDPRPEEEPMIDKMIDELEDQVFHLQEALKISRKKLRKLKAVRDMELKEPPLQILK